MPCLWAHAANARRHAVCGVQRDARSVWQRVLMVMMVMATRCGACAAVAAASSRNSRTSARLPVRPASIPTPPRARASRVTTAARAVSVPRRHSAPAAPLQMSAICWSLQAAHGRSTQSLRASACPPALLQRFETGKITPARRAVPAMQPPSSRPSLARRSWCVWYLSFFLFFFAWFHCAHSSHVFG